MAAMQDEALEQFVRGHVDFVYAAAARQMGGNLSAAEDVTQAVMMVLMRKGQSGALPKEEYMSGWLLKATRYAVLAARRGALRRAIHEGNAAKSREQQVPADSHAEQQEIRGLLDEALLRLASTDREVVVRRYMREESVAVVGQALGMNENAAGRRIARALEKLRKILSHQGITPSLSIVLGVMAGEALVKAPAATAAVVATAATGKTAAALAKTVVWRMLMAKISIGVGVATVATLLGVAAVVGVQARGEKTAASPPATSSTAPSGPLKANGTIDYIAALNAKYGHGVTPENNGFLIWLNVMGAKAINADIREQMLTLSGVSPRPPETGWTRYPNRQELDLLRAQLWKAEDHPKFTAHLASHDALLALAAQAAEKPQWWEPAASKNGTMTWILLPDLNSLDDVSRTLAARATLRAGQNNFTGFLADVMTIKRLARLAPGWSTLGRIVAVHMDGCADQAIGATAGKGLFSAAECAKLDASLDVLGPLPPISESADVAERWDTLEFASAIKTGGLDGWLNSSYPDYDRSILAFAGVDSSAIDWEAMTVRMNAMFDEVTTVLKTRDIKEAVAAAQAFEKKIRKNAGDFSTDTALARQPGETKAAYTARVASAVMAMHGLSMWQAESEYRGALVQDNMARAIVAAAQYYAEHQKWPQELHDLVPAYLPAVPSDLFSRDGNPVIYKTGAEGIQLYSVGLNGRDDGGFKSPDGHGPDDLSIGVESLDLP